MVHENREILERLEAVIRQRCAQLPEGSYTTRLINGGVAAIGAKVTEEAGEVVEAAGEAGVRGQQHLVREAADLIYHLIVLLAYRDVRLAQVEAELAGREGVSGLEEKAARKRSAPRGGSDSEKSELEEGDHA